MTPLPLPRRRALVVTLATALALSLSACGGGSDVDTPAQDGRSDAKFALKDVAHILNASNARLLAQDDQSITLEGVGAAGLKAGNVIVSTLGQGALRRVIAVQSLGQNSWRFTTEQAALTDAFERFNLQYSKELTADDLGSSFDTGDPGLELGWAPAATGQSVTGSARPQAQVAGPSLTLGFKKWEVSASRGFEVTGNANFRLQPDFNVALVPVANSRIPALTYRAALAPAYSHRYTVSSLYGGDLGAAKSKEIPLRPIVIASPPVTIVPVIVVSAKVSGTAAGKFSATHTASINGSAYAERRADGTGDVGHTFQPLMTGQFDAVEAAFGTTITPASISLEFRLYNVGGPQFTLAAHGQGAGVYERDGLTGAEGIRARLTGDLTFTGGVGGSIGFLSKLFSDFRGDFTLFSKDFVLLEGSLYNHFFPFSGSASIQVFDSGNVADDIFEVSVDGVVLGRTAKGGSGQFRVTSLRPGPHSLRLLTVEDDSPPGTWSVKLSNGVTFADGSTARSGGLSLGASTELSILVPQTSP